MEDGVEGVAFIWRKRFRLGVAHVALHRTEYLSDLPTGSSKVRRIAVDYLSALAFGGALAQNCKGIANRGASAPQPIRMCVNLQSYRLTLNDITATLQSFHSS